MVDYNIALPQQQLYQAPDPMQNFLRMQQMDQMGATSRLRNMQADQLRAAQQQAAAERAQAAVIEEEASGAVRRGASPTEAAENLTREGKLGAAARISAHGKTLSEGQKAELDTVDNTIKGFAYWSTHVRAPEEAGALGAGMYNTSRLRPFFDSIGIKSAEQAAQKFSTDFVTDENAWRTGMAKLDAPTLFSLRAAKQVEIPGGGMGTIYPNKPGVINEAVILEAGAPQPGAGAGRVDTYPDPNLAARQDTQRRLGLPVTVNDGGLVARADTGAPVNALAAGQRQQPAVVGNAMAAPVAAASPYGALAQPQAAPAPGVVGSREFARRAEEAKLQEGVRKVGLETLARERATATVKNEEFARVDAPKIINAAEMALSQIKGLIGDAQIDAKGNIVYPKGGQKAHPGFTDAVGASASKIWRGAEKGPYPGTARADFEARHAQAQGGAFLEAYNTLRGAGGISGPEGEKGTTAISRMNLATSEAEYVSAARDLAKVIEKGIAVVNARAGAPSNAGVKAPAVGAVEDGHRFKGGDPAKADSWEKI